MLGLLQTGTNSINGRLEQRFGTQMQPAVCHLSRFVSILKRNNANSTFSHFLEIKPQLVEASFHFTRCFEECKKLLEGSLSDMDTKISDQLVSQKNTNELLKSKSNQIATLNKSIRAQERSIKDMESKIKEYDDDLNKEKHELEKWRSQETENHNDCENAATALIVTALIPGINLIAGPISYGVLKYYIGQKKEIRKRISLTISNMSESRRALVSMKADLRSKLDDKTEKEREKTSLQKEEEDIKSNIRMLKEEQTKGLEMQGLLRLACKLASEIYGEASVLHDETENGYSEEPLVFPLKELVESTVKISRQHIGRKADEYDRMLTQLQYDVNSLSLPALTNVTDQ